MRLPAPPAPMPRGSPQRLPQEAQQLQRPRRLRRPPARPGLRRRHLLRPSQRPRLLRGRAGLRLLQPRRRAALRLQLPLRPRARLWLSSAVWTRRPLQALHSSVQTAPQHQPAQLKARWCRRAARLALPPPREAMPKTHRLQRPLLLQVQRFRPPMQPTLRRPHQHKRVWQRRQQMPPETVQQQHQDQRRVQPRLLLLRARLHLLPRPPRCRQRRLRAALP